MTNPNNFKLDKKSTKKIILEALYEHQKNIKEEDNPTIENIVDESGINNLIYSSLKYGLLYILLTIATSLFIMVISIDYTQAFNNISIVKIAYVFFLAFILLMLYALISLPTVKLYDSLVLEYTKFTRAFSIRSSTFNIKYFKTIRLIYSRYFKSTNIDNLKYLELIT